MKTRRNFSFQVTLLLWMVLILTTSNVVRLVTAILWRDTLETYASYPGPIYIAATGALWASLGSFLLWSWWHRKPNTRTALFATSVAYTLWIWADRLFIQTAKRANWPFDLLITVILLAFVTTVIFNPNNLNYFRREAYEREPENHASS